MFSPLRNLLSSRVSSRTAAFRSAAALRMANTAAAAEASTNENVNNNIPTAVHEQDKLYTKLEIELRGVDPAVLKSYSWFATTAAGHLGVEVGKCWAQRKAHHDRMTLLKSVHIYKKHRAQYEIRTYFRYMDFHKLTGSTLETFLEYIERNLPEGVALHAKKTEILEMPEHLREQPKME